MAVATATRAQELPPPYLAFVEGTASVDREGDVQPAALNMPLVPGDRVITQRGRVEVLFPDGSALDVDQYSTVDLLTPIRINVAAGRAIFVVPGDVNRQYATRYEIDTPANTIVTSGFGTYRADATSGSTSWQPDAFDQWAEARYAERGATTSGQYLPQDLRVYGGTLDHYGSWQYDMSYGYVWYPTVAPGWRPYYNGYWEPLPRYGWTWIGADVWAWPTHHYGRWGYSRTRWFWIPGRTYGPAWVSWGAADGYVGWCPLGFDNRPVFALSVGVGYPSNGWVVVPRTSFGARGSFVNRFAVAPHQIPVHSAFIVQSVPPVAVPREIGRRALIAGTNRADAAATRSRADQSRALISTNPGASQQSPSVAGAAVPRRAVPGQRSIVERPDRAGASRQPGVVAQPRYSVPAFRSPQPQESTPSRRDLPGSVGPLPDQPRVMPEVPRGTQGTPGAIPRSQPTTPPRYDLPAFRSPVAVPRNNPTPGYGPPQVTPRWSTSGGATPPVTGVVPMAPRMPPAPAPAIAVPRAAPVAPAPPPTAAPAAAPAAHGTPSRSGGGEGHARSRGRG